MDLVNSDEEINSDSWSNSQPEECRGDGEYNEDAPGGQHKEPSSLEEGEEKENSDDFEDYEDNDGNSFQKHSLLDDLELKFRMILAAKIDEVQQLFDDAELVLMIKPEDQEEEPIPHSSKAIQNPVPPPSWEEAGLRISDDENSSIAQVRHEIYMLRNCRESLIAQRQRWSLQLQRKSKRKNAQQKLYELEESIEIIDTVIEFKNEIISRGNYQQPKPPPPQTESEVEAELSTTMDLLTPEELKRLLSKSLLKIVELRSSSRSLEKEVEQMESSNDKLKNGLKREHKLLKETKLDYQARIRLLFSGGNENSKMDLLLKQMDDKLGAARKKQYDLERSLTELLVRHGYLVNGADYDVKQVVRMLGIEENGVPPQVGVEVENAPPQNSQNHHRRRRRESQVGAERGGGGEGSRARRRRNSAAYRPRLYGVHWHQRRFSGGDFHHRRRNERELDSDLHGNMQQREGLRGRRRFVENWMEEREPRRARRNVQPPPEVEVWREKNKLVIQQYQDDSY